MLELLFEALIAIGRTSFELESQSDWLSTLRHWPSLMASVDMTQSMSHQRRLGNKHLVMQ